MNLSIINAIIRHVLTAIGGVLVSVGALTSHEADALLNAVVQFIGALTFIIGMIWSIADKVRR